MCEPKPYAIREAGFAEMALPLMQGHVELLTRKLRVATDALKRNRAGCLNILEMRKLSSEQWGQRDGYGGRYGALTREEIETVIGEIDAALNEIEKEG